MGDARDGAVMQQKNWMGGKGEEGGGEGGVRGVRGRDTAWEFAADAAADRKKNERRHWSHANYADVFLSRSVL